ncbi:winged helix-turn-helix transcriptional regulator [Streptomyces roseoverticillatus]|uniref:GntR family transcriptional regulator n=1 Tax=Streptomyces roseoverticillatus TaxID=66429 RepID=UPI001F2303E2|nr:GntR family transcriptional regulator [Streptomyces roseoverticillatus]MCF3104500.1 winged helix-turn-helix transcriptional regulator [Streptomyces roseoverticillatus]
MKLMVEWTGTPAYQQVADALRRRIAAGEFDSSGGQLPSLAELQTEFEITITVARGAIGVLKAEGLVVSHQGKGAFLSAGAADRARRADPQAAVDELRHEVSELRREVAELRARVTELGR